MVGLIIKSAKPIPRPLISMITSRGLNAAINFLSSNTCKSKTFSSSVLPKTKRFTKLAVYFSPLGKTFNTVATD